MQLFYAVMLFVSMHVHGSCTVSWHEVPARISTAHRSH